MVSPQRGTPGRRRRSLSDHPRRDQGRDRVLVREPTRQPGRARRAGPRRVRRRGGAGYRPGGATPPGDRGTTRGGATGNPGGSRTPRHRARRVRGGARGEPNDDRPVNDATKGDSMTEQTPDPFPWETPDPDPTPTTGHVPPGEVNPPTCPGCGVVNPDRNGHGLACPTAGVEVA